MSTCHVDVAITGVWPVSDCEQCRRGQRPQTALIGWPTSFSVLSEGGRRPQSRASRISPEHNACRLTSAAPQGMRACRASMYATCRARKHAHQGGA